jgi:hypothetical protein
MGSVTLPILDLGPIAGLVARYNNQHRRGALYCGGRTYVIGTLSAFWFFERMSGFST